MSRTLYYSKDGSKKYVTCQVQPSRFLYELVPSKKRVDGVLDGTGHLDEPFVKDNLGTVWNRNAGVKDYVAGNNVPEFFQKAYRQPRSSVNRRADLRQHSSVSMSYTEDLTTPEDITKNDITFQIGDQVMVSDKKHKQYGKIGIINKVTKCFVFFTENITKLTIRIKPSFLQTATNSKTDAAFENYSSLVEGVSKQNESYMLNENEAERAESLLKKQTVKQLKSRLRALKLPVNGRKAELINRLIGK